MKNLRITTGILAIILMSFVSCKGNKQEQIADKENPSEMAHDNSDGHHNDDAKHDEKHDKEGEHNGNAEAILKDYFNLKNALVADE